MPYAEKITTLMYGWEYPPNISGGLGVACHAIVQDLMKKNVQVNLILPYELAEIIEKNHHRDTIIKKLEQTRCNIYQIDSLLQPYCDELEYQKLFIEKNSTSLLTQNITDFYSHNFRPIKLTGRYGANLFAEVLRYAEVASALAENIDHDIIHAHDWMTILAGINSKRISNKPLVFHVHALEVDRSGIEHINKQVFDIEKYGLNEADLIVAVSNYTKNIIVNYYGIPASKIAVIYNGIDAAYANNKGAPLKHQHKTVLFLGRVTHQKGPYHFVEIAKRILETRPDVQFVIAGAGNLLTEMIEKVAFLRIGQNVHFTGFLDPQTVKQIYRLADVYVMPSVSEPFGISCLEALSYDVPVVISNQSGAAEALQHVLHADFWDIDEMASKILALLDHKALQQELLTNVKKEMKYLTWDRTGNEIINAYQKLIAR